MRVAALADIHGNIHALEAVLAELERERVDAVVSCGDVDGPFGRECVARLERLPRVHFVKGNADEAFDWPATVELEVDGLGEVAFCHGSPRRVDEILTKVSSDERVASALAGTVAAVVVGGHTHVQFDRRAAAYRLVNAGSVGMPYEGVRGAFWALLGPDAELRRTDYDVDEAAAALEAAGATDQAGWLREPPDPDEVSAYFEGQANPGA